jgi:cellulose biosynthesis protein BcsQ
MAKINIVIPEPPQQYSVDSLRQINQALETLQNQLNTSYQNDLLEDLQTFNWFLFGAGAE